MGQVDEVAGAGDGDGDGVCICGISVKQQAGQAERRL